MRKLVLALSAIAAIGFLAPMTTPAKAEKIVIKNGHRHNGFFHREHHNRKVIVIKHGHRHHGY